MRKSKIARAKPLVYLILLVIVILAVVFIPKTIVIQEVACISQFGNCPETITQALQTAVGQNLAAAKKQLRSSLNENLIVSQYALALKLPATLEVNLLLRKPVYAIKTPAGYYQVSRDGRLISVTDSSGLPWVESVEPRQVGEKLDDKTLFALKIAADVFSLYPVESSRLNADDLTLQLKTGTQAIFPLTGDNKVLVGALRLLIEQLNSGSEKFRIDKGVNKIVIDLRYKNPVIR